jgi:hypothetical protein
VRRARTGRDQPDQHLTLLTCGQAEELRRQVRIAFAARGREVVVLGGHVRDDTGATFGLWDLAAACREARGGQRAWPGVIAEHVRRITASVDAGDPFAGLTTSEVLSRTYARILACDRLPDWDSHRYAWDLAPELKEVLCLDMPETVVIMNDGHVARCGGAGDLRRAGLANLRTLPIEDRKDVQAPDGGHFTVLLGTSLYTASRALVMPALIESLLGPADLTHGVLVGLPNRHQVVVHVIRDKTVLATLPKMARFVELGYDDSPGPLSRQLHWWRAGHWEQIIGRYTTDSIAIGASAEFRGTIAQVAGPPRP